MITTLKHLNHQFHLIGFEFLAVRLIIKLKYSIKLKSGKIKL